LCGAFRITSFVRGARRRARAATSKAPAAALFAQRPGLDGAAQGARYFGERLVAGKIDDAVARREGPRQKSRMASSAPACTMSDSAPMPLVERGETGPQAGIAPRLGIAEPQIKVALLGSLLEGEELARRHRLAVGAREEVPGAELELGEEALEGEGLEECHWPR
jgi:hypothetical protein